MAALSRLLVLLSCYFLVGLLVVCLFFYNFESVIFKITYKHKAMKKKYFRSLVALILLLSAFNAHAQIQQPKEALPAHPRLLFMKGSEKNVQSVIDKDKRLRKLHNHIISLSDSILNVPCNERIKRGIRLLHVSRLNINYILHLSYSYRMTGDERYAERAKAELLKLSSFSDWNPSHFLDVAEMGLAAAIGYDWLYDYLDSESKGIIEQALVEKIIQPSLGKHAYNLKRSNNWNQVCNTGTSISALAIYEKMPEQTVQILNNAIMNLPVVMKEYAPHGAYIEGYGYWGYGTTYNVILIDLLDKLFGQDYGLKDQPGFMQTATFHQSLVTPSLHYYNYGDNKDVPANGVCPAIFWFYKETQDQDLLYNLKQALSLPMINLDEETHRFTPLALVWAAEGKVNFNRVKAPQVLWYQGMGQNPVVCFRSSWADNNAAFVGFKGGRDRISHGHQDAGSFIYEVNQVRWAMELGQEDYNKLEQAKLRLWGEDRWKIYRYSCFNHNMFTFNGQPIIENQFIELQPIHAEKTAVSCEADLSALFIGHIAAAARKISLVKKNCVIEDHIKCNEKDARICWRMATEADRLVREDDSTITLYKGNEKLNEKLKMTIHNNNAALDGMVISLKPAESKQAYDSPNPGISFVEFTATLPANSENNLKIILRPF